MKCLKHVFAFVLILLWFNSTAQTDAESVTSVSRSYHLAYLQQELGIPIPDQANLALYDTISDWLKTPYHYSGNGQKGVDCSGFVTLIYDKVFCKKLGARNSADIYKHVQKLDRDELENGDLVFFRIRKHRISHVGIYLGDGFFAHSSTSHGVIISNLKESYYKKYFAGAGRSIIEQSETISQNNP